MNGGRWRSIAACRERIGRVHPPFEVREMAADVAQLSPGLPAPQQCDQRQQQPGDADESEDRDHHGSIRG
jgi:hypothetical protein